MKLLVKVMWWVFLFLVISSFLNIAGINLLDILYKALSTIDTILLR